MTLVDRLFSQRARFITGMPRCYVFQDQTFFSIADVARLVLERYARRFGVLNQQKARKMHERLALRFCPNAPHLTQRALDRDISNRSSIVYPETLRHSINLAAILSQDHWRHAEKDCRLEGRKFIPAEHYESARQTPQKRLLGRLRAAQRQDENNIRQCKKLISTIKEHFNENR